MLDNNHVSTFLRGNGVNFGYCNLEAPVYTAMPYDAQSNQRSVTAAERPQYRSLLSGTDKFMKRTADTSYNEITYFTNNQVIIPNYILVTNREPNELEYRIAKAFNIPILVYHTKDIEWKKDSDYVEMEAFDYETLVLDYIPREESRQVVFDK